MLTLKHGQTIRNQGCCKFHNFDIIYGLYFLRHMYYCPLHVFVNLQPSEQAKTVDTDSLKGESKNSK